MKKSMKYRLLLIFIGIISAIFNLSGQLSVIKTENGLVSGYKNGEISIFQGIPFAQPPLGELR